MITMKKKLGVKISKIFSGLIFTDMESIDFASRDDHNIVIHNNY